MDSNTEEMFRILGQADDVFTDHGRDQTVTESKIHIYLASTEGTPMNRAQRLTMLAIHCAEFGWDVMSQICEYVIRTEPIEDQHYTLCVWARNALDNFMPEKSDLTIEARCRVADDLQNILNNALKVSSQSGALATFYGELYLKHPLRKQDEPFYLQKAVEWFEAAKRWSEDQDLDYEVMSSLADAYCLLERWSDALAAYKRLKQLHLKIRGSEACPEIESKLVQCQKKLLS